MKCINILTVMITVIDYELQLSFYNSFHIFKTIQNILFTYMWECVCLYTHMDTYSFINKDIAGLLKATSILAYNYVYIKALIYTIQYITSNICIINYMYKYISIT